MGQKKEIIVKIIRKVKKSNGKKFPVYSGITSLGNWFDIQFTENVVKPTKTSVFLIKPDNWFVTTKKNKDEDGEYTIDILNKKGEKIKKLVIKQLDEELTEDDERFPDSLKYEGITEV